jgi:hypothetical protein
MRLNQTSKPRLSIHDLFPKKQSMITKYKKRNKWISCGNGVRKMREINHVILKKRGYVKIEK